MEQLLDEADALVLTGGEEMQPKRPDFDIPEEFARFTEPHDLLVLQDSRSGGKGWHAKRNVPAGSMLMIAKPLTLALDWEWDPDIEDPIISNNGMDEEYGEAEAEVGEGHDDGNDASENSEDSMPEPAESQINELLVLQLLQDISVDPSIWTDKVTNLYPRDPADIQASPVWVSKDDEIFTQFEALVKQCEQHPALRGKAKEISQRLPLIVRYNVLSIETCPEMLSYPGPTGHSGLQGVGLYHLPSFFNHNARPNVSRYAIGDVMWFVANQDIPAGTETCISYLEHDILCESAYRRNLVLTLDFKEDEAQDQMRMADGTIGSAPKGGPDMPVVDSDVQNELMMMSPFERLESIEQLMAQASGEALPEDEANAAGTDADADGMEIMDGDAQGGAHTQATTSSQISPLQPAWFQCDLQNLRILKAITLDAMGLSHRAIELWNQCIAFTEAKMPPNDEASIVMRVQGALCALHMKDEAQARQHATVALQRHHLMFGGGIRRFRRRFQTEFCLALRPSPVAGSGGSSDNPLTNQNGEAVTPHDFLWPLGSE